MSAHEAERQLIVLRHGLNLLYRWCCGQWLEELPVAVGDFIRQASQSLVGSDIFDKTFTFPQKNLKSIFSEIRIPPDGETVPYENIPHQLEDGRFVFYDSPVGESWKEQAATEIKQNHTKIKDNPMALLVLLEKYGSFIPISTKTEYQSISLYEHVKFLSCLASAGEASASYLFVSADFSGIQGFVYMISSKGALKSLRARSFFLELLAQHIIYEILTATDATVANIIYSGGGGFALLLENSKRNVEVLKRVKEVIDAWLLSEHRARIYLGMEWVKLERDETSGPVFKKKWLELGKLLDQDKHAKFKTSIADLLRIEEPIQKTSEEECQICHRDDFEQSRTIKDLQGRKITVCHLCETLFWVGDELTDYKYILRSSQPSEKSLCFPSLDGSVYYRLSGEIGESEARWVKNSWDVREYINDKSLLFLAADYVTKERKGPTLTADFETLAKASAGKWLIGTLRMDADNLGLIFTQGLGKRFDLPHYSALSRQINFFFTVYINLLCAAKIDEPLDIMGKRSDGDQGRKVTVIYSGGDDLLVVGAWDEIAELAYDVAKTYSRYTGRNPDISISGGVVLTKPDFPLYQIASLGLSAQELAKKMLPDCRKNECSPAFPECALFRGEEGKCARKGAGLLFYVPARAKRELGKRDRIVTTLNWEEIGEKVIKVVKLFRELSKVDVQTRLELENIPHGFVRRLFEVVYAWEREGIVYLPLMRYIVTRLNEALAQEVKKTGKEEQLKTLNTCLLRTDMIEALWLPLTWVDFLMRKGGE